MAGVFTPAAPVVVPTDGVSWATSSPPETMGVNVIVPTLHEVDNLPHLIDRLAALRRSHSLDLDLLIMDDDSRDGSRELVAGLGLPWVRLVTRTANHGLSPAVVDGLKLADRPFVVVMDADLSHPPEAIPQMLARLEGGADFVIGSRYVAGGAIDADWGPFRRLNSKVATLLARPFTDAKDPMAGFFAFRRSLLDRADPLDPVGYKIGLELIVKCRCRNVQEVPIRFSNRQRGKSKLTLKEQLRYLQHLHRLFLHTHPRVARIARSLFPRAEAARLPRKMPQARA